MPRDIRYQIAIDREPDLFLTDEAAEIEVQQSIDSATSFRVRFAIDLCNGDLTLVDDERLQPNDPDTEVTIVAIVDGETFCLVHGVITERRVNLTEGGPGSWLEIEGQDRRILMDRVDRRELHEGKASEIVERIVKRADYGFVPDVTRTQIQFSEEKHALNQAMTDLAFVNQLAGKNGFRFWVSCDVTLSPLGQLRITETAHFKPSPARGQDNDPLAALPTLLSPAPAPELKVNNGDGCSNLTSFQMKANAERPNQTDRIRRVNADDGKVDNTQVNEPTTEPLGEQPPPGQKRTRRLVTAGDAQEARLVNQAALNDAAWSAEAQAETTVHALGAVIAPHQVVKLTGAGKLTSGDYFVKSVRHSIDPATHKMNLELLRNALGG